MSLENIYIIYIINSTIHCQGIAICIHRCLLAFPCIMITKTAISSTPFTTLFLWLLLAVTLLCSCYESFNVGCHPNEREALLKFKHDLEDPSNRLASWAGNRDCCSWFGIICDNSTGHVHELHLRTSPEEYHASSSLIASENYVFRGKINPSLVDLKHLRYLDLSYNDFGGIPIPTFLGSMGSLRYLNLSRAGFGGKIPHQLGNLSSLVYLNLQSYYDYTLHGENLDWLSGLSSLEVLVLNGLNLQKIFSWLEVLNTLPYLVELHLSNCQLLHVPPLLNFNFSSLSILDLSWNHFSESSIFRWVSSHKTLNSLNLADNYFQGPIPNQLQNITSLRKLDLSWNHFNSSMPNWLYGFTHLELLKLSGNELQGKISKSIGNMSSLMTLDLSYTNGEFEAGSLKNLCNMRELYLSGINLRREINDFFEKEFGCVPDGLEFLGLRHCQLFGNLVTDHLGKFQNLAYLNLAGNLISGSIPMSLGEMTSLRVLYLYDNKLNGTLPINFGKLQKLESLVIFNNSISGQFPTVLKGLASLREINLSQNKLNGTLPFFFGEVKQLKFADISYNYLEGKVSEIHFQNLTNLRFFIASGNQLQLKVSPNWTLPLQLELLKLGSWLIGPQFPMWLHSPGQLWSLDLSNSGISDSIPIWFWNHQIEYLNLSHNQIYGALPKKVTFSTIDLSSNRLMGPLPYFSSFVIILDLSNNSFSGSMSNFLCHKMHEMKQMQMLNLRGNLLSGKIPNCWRSWKNLKVINLSNNGFKGNIPMSIEYLSWLQSLHLRNNKLSGEFPLSLKNCTMLVTLDIGGNEFVGNIPSWIGETLSEMRFLILRSNKFYGHIPKELCHLDSLQVLDLAQNNLSGTIPKCINNCSAMATQKDSFDNNFLLAYLSQPLIENELLVMKGKEVEYSTILQFVRSMDLSDNKLCGGIPEEVTGLGALQSLNLSQNLLTGRIPENIGVMRGLECLDLSLNQISGAIPQSMASLAFLSHLNLSNNKLSGRIPLGTQLQGFQASSFDGNKLCGPPLKNCIGDGTSNVGSRGHKEDCKGWRINWFYVSMTFGFVMGFWGVVGPLLFNRRWRLAYFSFLDNLEYSIRRCFIM